MNIKNKCEQINSLLGDLSSTGLPPIPDLVFEIRLILHKIESLSDDNILTAFSDEFSQDVREVISQTKD